MSLPSSDNNASTIVSIVKTFLAWWGRELASLIPKSLKDGAHHSGRFLMIALEASEAVILLKNKSNWTEEGRIPLDSTANTAHHSFDSMTRSVVRSKTPVVLRLPAQHGLLKILEFPLASARDLRKILENQMGRVTPYQAHQVYFDYRLLDRDFAKDKLRVELIASPRDFVDVTLTKLESWGIKPDFLDLGDTDKPTVHMINLSERSNDGEQVRTRPWLNGLLVLANVILIAIVLGTSLAGKAKIETELHQQVATWTMKAAATAKLRAKVDQARAETVYLGEQKRTSPRAIVMLNEVTKVMPDGTWLEHIKFKNNVVQLYGYSPRAATLIAITERSPMFQNAQFRAPVTQHGPHGTERFHLSADLVSKVK